MKIGQTSSDKEWMIWVIISLPFLYLATIWSSLPETVPIHFNIRGEPDDWGSKNILIYATTLLMGIIYILFRIIPFIDPKKGIQKMGNKYFQIRFIFTVFMALLSLFIIYSAKAGSIKNPQLLFSFVGILLMVLGNYFPSIKPNYFMGIRTPWTLESDEVWRKTHRFAGKFWVAGGLIFAIVPFFLKDEPFFYTFMALILVMVAVPVVYSYRVYKESDKDLV